MLYIFGLVLQHPDVMPSDADGKYTCEINLTIRRETLAPLHIAFVIMSYGSYLGTDCDLTEIDYTLQNRKVFGLWYMEK